MLTRREFGARLAAVSGAMAWGGPLAVLAAAPQERRRSLLAALAAEERNYDMAEQMLRKTVKGPGYHSTLKNGIVHPTRDALTYAAALLESGQPQHLDRAEAILKRVTRLQDQNPASKTCGIWSWYLEEPLDRMAPPDWNWADFCGVQLLAAWMGHRTRLDPAVAAMVRESIGHAARSIRKRDVGPGYTNIAIMGTYVTLVAGEQLEDAALAAYGKARLRRLHAFVTSQGSFSEYNSPTYSIVALTELTRILAHARDEAGRQLAREIHDLAWRHVAVHFHAPTRQWTGPQSRSYGDDLRRSPATLAFLEAACAGEASLGAGDPLPLGLDACRLAVECPASLRSHFRELKTARGVVETFIPASPGRSGAARPVVGTTWLDPRFALGTVNRGDFWNQRRPWLACWGTVAQPVIVRARFLKDGVDFCSALVFSDQHEGRALSTVVFADDYGDFHPSLDRVRDGSFKARDLRLRLECCGSPKDVVWSGIKEPAAVVRALDRGIELRLRPGTGVFDGKPVRWERCATAGIEGLDAVLYSGAESVVDLKSIREAFLVFGASVGPKDRPEEGVVESAMSGGWIRSAWAGSGRVLRVEAPVKPGGLARLNDQASTGQPGGVAQAR